MLIYLFFILRGIYTYPLKVPAVAIGAISLVSSVMFTGAVIVLNIKNIDNLDDDYFDPFCYRSMNGIILGSSQGILHAVLSALVIYGAVKDKRFFLVPWIIKMCVSMGLNLYWTFSCLSADNCYNYWLLYLTIVFVQVQITASICRFFQELTEIGSYDSESQLPYGKMNSSLSYGRPPLALFFLESLAQLLLHFNKRGAIALYLHGVTLSFIFFPTKKGIYTYPLKRVAKIIGSLSLVASVVFIALVIILNYDDDISGRSVNQYYHPLVYGTMNGIYLACFQGIIHCIASGMVIYGAAKEQRFFLIPWLFKMLVSIGLNIYWMIACLAANVYPSYYLVYLAFAIIQSQVTTSVFIHFRELTEAKLGGLESQLPYGKMTNSVA